ncbi:hypothetical protein WG66_011378 [Moniliophthora roreri]|uniref:Uncharacterized protein n=1 Tax=Moniliophthora roreri TaxID=221103 RepID=A0A0W0GBN0_MONRR|nr:hypothetical protein WG66_011378 [Moniliophthora roreri]
MSFSNSSGFPFSGENYTLNHVQGNQVHHTNQTISGGMIHMHNQNTTQVTERTRYDEFDVIKTGNVIGMKDLGSVDLSEWDLHWQNGKIFRQRHKPTRKTISTVQVHPNQQSKFTAITYEGEGAQEAWEDDFKRFSHARFIAISLEMILLLISGQSDGLFSTLWYQSIRYPNADLSPRCVPPTFFHQQHIPKPEHIELIPVAHFYTKTLWMNVYIYYLSTKRGCHWKDLWLNTSSGVVCKSPTGPRFTAWAFVTDASAIQTLPSSLDMLEEETSVAFFSKLESNVDSGILECARWFQKITYLDDLFPNTTEDHQHEDNNHPHWSTNYPYLRPLWRWRNLPHHLPSNIISGLCFDTVYSPSLEPVVRWPPEARGLWKWRNVDGLAEETRIDGGLTRFKLIGQGGKVRLKFVFDRETFWKDWFTQSSCVFDLLKTTGHQESFFVVDPPVSLELRSTRREYEAYNGPLASSDPCDAVEETRPIYLFLYPPPMTISELISWVDGRILSWSFDEDGRSRIPEEEWARWGIPILTPYADSCILLYSWPTHIYSALRNWQIARGFDPSTADWVRECGYPEYEIIGAKKDGRFKEIPEQPEKSGWSLSRLWTAIPGLDISACAC